VSFDTTVVFNEVCRDNKHKLRYDNYEEIRWPWHILERADEPYLSTRVFACLRPIMGKPHAIVSLGKSISQTRQFT